jgi:type IV pilus biogenesis protein CpaD/CtpE
MASRQRELSALDWAVRITGLTGLSAAHAQALRKAADKYIRAGRKVTQARRPGGGNNRRAANGYPSPTDVREWAKSQGIAVKDRGRVSSELAVKFQAATRAQLALT